MAVMAQIHCRGKSGQSGWGNLIIDTVHFRGSVALTAKVGTLVPLMESGLQPKQWA